MEYAILGLLLSRALFAGEVKSQPAMINLLAFFIAAIYAASDEFHQLFIIGRHADFFDWLSDSAGAAFGSFVLFSKMDAVRKIWLK